MHFNLRRLATYNARCAEYQRLDYLGSFSCHRGLCSGVRLSWRSRMLEMLDRNRKHEEVLTVRDGCTYLPTIGH